MLTPLEKAVIDALLERGGEHFDIVHQQLKHARIAKREYTGVGFFTKFALPEDSPVRRDLPDATLGNVGAGIPGLEHGAGFLLFIRSGVVTMLEGFTYANDQWPKRIDDFRIFQTVG